LHVSLVQRSCSCTLRAVIASTLYPPVVRRIVDLLDAGATSEALSIASLALANANERDAAILLCMQANALVIRGEPFHGLKMADAGHRHAVRLNQPLIVAEAKQSLAFALQALDKHALAIDLVTECEHIATEHADSELLARSWRALGISMSVLGRHEVAIDYLKRSLELLQKNAYAQTRVLHAHYSLLNAQSRALSADTSDHMSDRFAKLHDEWEDFTTEVAMENNARLHAMALGNAAIAARRAGRKIRALEQFQLALALQTRMQLHAHCAMTECHMGAVLSELGSNDDALAAYARGIALFQEGNPRSFSTALEEYSVLLENSGRTADALQALRRSRAIEKGLGDQAGHAAVSRIERDNEIATLSTQWLRLAEEDSLTGLPNRRAFDHRLAESIANASPENEFALAFLDIDFFKRINDSFGHEIGDRVLREVAIVICRELPATAFAARIGGEEFAVLFTTGNVDVAWVQTQSLITAIRAVDWTQISQQLSVTASAGFVAFTELTLPLSSSDLMRCADERLYRAKRDGRDRACNG
jgi:diguanylate cyclase (GGDEF)-like protein